MPDLRDLPSIDRLLGSDALKPLVRRFGSASVKRQLRDLQVQCRASGTAPAWAADPGAWAARVSERLDAQRYRPVFNLTGTVIHTNLGRALPDVSLFDAVRALVTRPMNLEFDLETGRRGDRDAPVDRHLAALTGAEAATVVNNNAAALLLVLNTLALERTVPVSRGELVEIGGSFRLPDLMQRAGCRLLEVGTTNRTHAADFENTAAHHPALLLKVHPSNFHIEGFTREVDAPAMAAIARSLGVPFCIDLGSGSLVDLARWGLPHEPTPQELLRQGADLVTFSGDKLLGSVQAGLIVGRRELVEACKRNPLKRALRPDKVTLALLEQTLALYEEPEHLAERLPLLRTLTLPRQTLEERARRVAAVLAEGLPQHRVEVADSECQIGSGALPDRTLPSVAVRVLPTGDDDPAELQGRLRRLPVPVIARLARGAVWLDMRGAEPMDELLSVLGALHGDHCT